VNETPTSGAPQRRRRRRERIRIATYLVFGAAAAWFITHPAPFPGLPPADLSAGDGLAIDSLAGENVPADSLLPGSLRLTDTAAVSSPLVRRPTGLLPRAIVPKRRLFRSIEERARASERIAVSVTAYCLQGRTRRGNPVRDGIIAVDRALFPLGREVDLFFGRKTYGRFLADDTGGVIKGGRIDVWMSDCTAARRFGRRRGYAQLVRRQP